MALPISRFVPSRPRGRLDWRDDPLFGLKKESITPAQGRAGLAYNKALYAPDSASARAVFRPPTPTGPTYRPASTAWEAPTGRVAPGDYASRYGTASLRTFPGQEATEGVARLRSANPFNPENPNLSGIDGPDPSLPPPGVAGPTGETGAANPNLTPPEPAPSPYLESDGYVPGMPAGWAPPGDTPKQTSEQNPLNASAALGLIPRVGAPMSTGGPTNSTEAQTTRYYDRKFSRNSKDPVERMQARRIDGRAPNVSVRPNRVTFENKVPGHSAWQPY